MATPLHPLPMPKANDTSAQQQQNLELPKDAPVLKIKFPIDRKEEQIINEIARYVAKEGYHLEQCIAEEFKHHPKFKFLFEVESVAHIYYRWKLYSLSQNDAMHK